MSRPRSRIPEVRKLSRTSRLILLRSTASLRLRLLTAIPRRAPPSALGNASTVKYLSAPRVPRWNVASKAAESSRRLAAGKRLQREFRPESGADDPWRAEP